MSNYTDKLDNKDAFVKSVKDDIRARVFSQLDIMKKEMANDFLKSGE